MRQFDFAEEFDRIEVLERVSELLLLPTTEYATIEQVARYYRVEQTTIQQICEKYIDELSSDGMVVLSGKEQSDTKSLSGLKSTARQLTLLPERAIYRVGMLLQNNEVAKELRIRLLDILPDATVTDAKTKNYPNTLTK